MDTSILTVCLILLLLFAMVIALTVLVVLRRGGSSRQGLTGAFGSYRIVRALRGGGMAEIYVVADSQRQQYVLKVLRANFMADPDTVHRFLMEGPIIRRIGDAHPDARIVACIESGTEQSTRRPYHILTYLRGTPLDEEMTSRGNRPLSDGEIRAVVRDIAGALDAIHAEGYCHQDVSADNVIVSIENREIVGATLVDFGVAVPIQIDADRTRGLAYGKPAYMSPEHFSGGTVNHLSDLYSLGVLMYQMAVGLLPFVSSTGDLMEVMEKHKHSKIEIPPRVHSPTRDIIAALLSKSPSDRSFTAAQVRSMMAEPPLPPEVSPRPEQRRGDVSDAPGPQLSRPGMSGIRFAMAAIAFAAIAGLCMLRGLWHGLQPSQSTTPQVLSAPTEKAYPIVSKMAAGQTSSTPVSHYKTCPKCGRRFGMDAKFCPYHDQAVLLVSH